MRGVLFFLVYFYFLPGIAGAQESFDSFQCTPLRTSKDCTPEEQPVTLAKIACQSEWKAAQCDDFEKANPSLRTQNKLKSCDSPSVCSPPRNALDFAKTCAMAGKEAWKDLLVGIVDFFVGKGGAPSVEQLAQLEFFKNCTTVECKYKLLGPFHTYFTKEEIEGHPERTDLNPEDVVNQNYLHGFSAAVLYRKLLFKLKKDLQTKNMNQKFIPPWSKTEAQPPLSMDELIDLVLQKMGLSHTECFKEEVVTEMRCYAFFSIVDPTLLASGAYKFFEVVGFMGDVARTANAAVKESKIANTLKRSVIKEDKTLAKTLVEGEDLQTELWNLRQAGQREAAAAKEKQIAQLLQSENIVDIKKESSGYTEPYVLTFDNGEKGIWKSGEWKGVDPDSEVFSYGLDKYLEYDRVPYTAKRKLGKAEGTIQYFIKDATEGVVDAPDTFTLFDYLVQNGDRHSGNYLIRNDKTIAIDHGYNFKPGAFVPDFPRQVDALISRQKLVDKAVEAAQSKLSLARRGGVIERNLTSLKRDLEKAQSAAQLSRARAVQEIAAMGANRTVKEKLAKTSQKTWNELTQNLTKDKQAIFSKTRSEALKAIERAEGYFGDSIFPQGPHSNLNRELSDFEGTEVPQSIQGSDL